MTPAQHTAPEAMVEIVCRAMQAVSRPNVDPDQLTPGPRGTVGLVPVWKLYEHMAEAAIAAISGQIREAALREAASLEPRHRRWVSKAQILALIEGANHA